jgi:uncharacterized protein (DUF342 family)
MPEDAIRLDVDPAGMQAVLHLPAGSSLPASAAIDRMMKAGVVAGVVEGALRDVEVPTDHDRDLVVAQGTPAVQPIHARIDVLVNFAIRLEEGTGHILDFREQGRFHEVEAGTVLARRTPPEQGHPGRTVLGKDLPVPEPKDAELSAIAGERTSLRGDLELVSDITGMVVRRHDGHLDVIATVVIPGDLDMHWGNLATTLPVMIQGDVIIGFNLKCGGDVEVKGVIEDARVSVKGNLLCGGILPGKQRVKAHGDLATKHVTGREVKCCNLIVANDVRGSAVYATGNVTAKIILSSQVHCGGSLVVDELGHRDELGGAVQVGVNPLAVALWRLAAREHEGIASEVADAKQLCKRIALWLKKEDNMAKRLDFAAKLQQALATYEQRIYRLGECENILNNAVLRAGNTPDATITVNAAVYPGVEIRIGTEARLTISKALIGKTVFRLREGKVVWNAGSGGTGTPGGEAAPAAPMPPLATDPAVNEGQPSGKPAQATIVDDTGSYGT